MTNNKYKIYQRYYSKDNGATWIAEDVYAKMLTETFTQDCGASNKTILYVDSTNIGIINPNVTGETYWSFEGELKHSTWCSENVINNPNGLTNVTVGYGITSIADNCFSKKPEYQNGREIAYTAKNLETAIIPNSVTSIGFDAFGYCSKLTSVSIGKGVTSIGDDCFRHCTSLNNITFNGTIEEWNEITIGKHVFDGTPTAYVHCSNGDVAIKTIEKSTQWIESDGHICNGYDKYHQLIEQVSYDNGLSWINTGNNKQGDLIEENSTDCGYIPPSSEGDISL